MDYYKPQTVDEALTLSNQDSVYIAGGTDLGVLFSELVISPELLIDLCGIKELKGVSCRDGNIRIGACTKVADIAAADDLPACLIKGAASIGSPQIRNMATIGGNICNASPCGDTLTPLMVLDAVFEISGKKGVRSLPAGEFFRGPKKTALEPGEILSAVIISEEKFKSCVSGFRMTGKRNGQVISQVNMAVLAEIKDGAVSVIRISAGSVAPVPLRLTECEKMCTGKTAKEINDDAFLKTLAATAEKETTPISDVRAGEEYRRAVSGALLTEIITELMTEGGAA